MDPQLKQRLTGAVALLLLGVLIIPWIFDGPPPGSPYAPREAPDEKPYQSTPAPPVDFKPPPPVQRQSIEPPAPLRKTAVLPPRPKPAEKKVSVRPPAPKAADPAKAKPSASTEKQAAKPVSGGWLVQVASLLRETGARKLVADLKKAGYPAYMERAAGKGKLWYRIRVGPIRDRNRANRTRKEIAKSFPVGPMLVLFRP